MNRSTTLLFAIVIGLIAVLAFFFSARHNPDSKRERSWIIRPCSPGDRAPEFTLIDIQGRKVSLGDYRGKIVIVNFWGISCVPCRQEIPDLCALQSRYGSKGLQVIGIGLDKLGELREFAEKSGMNYEVASGTDEVLWLFGGISGIPRTFIIDKRGTIVSICAEPRPGNLFEDEVRRLLDSR
jgi:peroxiredoxin